MRYISVLVFILISTSIMAQDFERPLDGVYSKKEIKQSEITDYSPLREADALWKRRIWRVIDLNEKMNLPFTWPKSKLIDVVMDAVANGELTAYDADVDDEFSKPLTAEDVASIGRFTKELQVMNPVTNQMETETVTEEFNRDEVIKYWLKEEWFFDKQRSIFECRIIGIAPIYNVLSEEGVLIGEKELFWIYFPEARNTFIHAEVFNRFNDAKRLSYDDLFIKRLFSSTIFKVANVYDRRVEDYKTGLDALYEAEAIKADIFNYEHDLWEF
ncbi:MAG: gliding motility associated protein GldN [Sphingobacteriales bacterium]|jgi:gliding motility associated protien GldN